MNFRGRVLRLYDAFGEKFSSHFGFPIGAITFNKVVAYLHGPRDCSSLAVTRILYGLAMLIDIPDERGGSTMLARWGDPMTCHFPLLPYIQAAPMPYMALVYAALWLGALGIMLGYKYRVSAATFATCYWYLLLIEKSYWNNHSYLFGLVAVLLAVTQANCFWSLDARQHASSTVPYWNYFLLKFQFFILYFVAGLKKGCAEWLTGYSLPELSEHWVFSPFKVFLTVPQIDYLIVHWFAFVFDLTVAFWMMWSRTRHVAMVFCAAFHLMNTRLFRIGMFPWVCLATMPLFYPFDWPKLVLKLFKDIKYYFMRQLCKNPGHRGDDKKDAMKVNENNAENIDDRCDDEKEKDDNNRTLEVNGANGIVENNDVKSKVTVCLIILYMTVQAFLPYSHFLTKGYNNWTNGLYGYSWDMMVHTWDTTSIVVSVVDNNTNKTYYIEPHIWTPNNRWTRHADMPKQHISAFSSQLIMSDLVKESLKDPALNVSVYIDIWWSMNGRFQQRMFDPKVDLLQAPWAPFENVPWLMPLLADSAEWRRVLYDIRRDVHMWNNHSDVAFVADFPGYQHESFLPSALANVTLTVLHGQVAYEPEVSTVYGQSHLLNSADSVRLRSGGFHKVHTLGSGPAYYMYTFLNTTGVNMDGKLEPEPAKPKLPVMREFYGRVNRMMKFFNLVLMSIFKLFFRLPLPVNENR